MQKRAGIVSFGAYIPKMRIKRELIARAWRRPGARGEKAVANYDEDALTLAVEAAFNCLYGINAETIDGLFFASTSPPYSEKEHASLVASVIDLKEEIETADFAHSLRAGTQAMRAAFNAVGSGACNQVLVTAGEQRAAEPGSEQEMHFGDGSAAFLVGDTDPLAEIEGFHSISHEFTDLWRRNQDTFVRSGDPQFTHRYGYQKTIGDGISGLMKNLDLEPKDIQKLVMYTPDFQGHRQVARGLGFDIERQLQNTYYDQIGIAGSAQPLILFAAALEESRPGDRILLASYGSGSDAFLFRITDRISEWKTKMPVKNLINKKMEIADYNHYLRYRDFIKLEVSTPFVKSEEPFTSIAFLWKERKQDMRFFGSRCKNCGYIQFPIRRVCLNCRAKDQMEDHRLSKNGVVYTFTKDNVFLTPDPPGIMVVVDLDGGGRFYGQMTECPEDRIRIDLPVELTYRKWHEAMGICHYFWKCRPIE